MKKKLVNDEIDLIEVFQIIWEKKNNIILSIVISLFLAFLIQISLVKLNKKNKINIKTEIKTIGIIEEHKYQLYNLALAVTKPIYANEGPLYELDKTDFKVNNLENFNITNITSITKEFLLKLFVEEIRSWKHLEYVIKKFNLIKEENYPNKIEYNTAINEILSNIKLSNLNNLNSQNVKIEYKTDDIERWKNFLKFLEVETNLIIQTKLVNMFSDYVNYLEIIKKYKIEDIESLLLSANDDKEILIINQKLSELKLNEYHEKINYIFESSPMNSKEEFYAVKINYDHIDYKKSTNKVSLKKLYVLAILLGAIIGIIFILIVNAIQKRS